MTELKTEIAVLQKLELVPFFTESKNLDSTLEAIAVEARKHVPDVSTDKGRKAITKNIGDWVTPSKTYLENSGKDLSAKYKEMPKSIDKVRKKAKDFLSDLQIECRLKLTEWEAEQVKIKAEKLAKEEAEKLAIQVEADHEIGLLLNVEFDRKKEEERLEAIAAQELRDQEIADKATKAAEDAAADKIKAAGDAAQKVIDDAKQEADDKAAELALKVKIESCHEVGLMMNADFDRRAADKLLEYAAEDKRIADKKIADDLAKRQVSKENRHNVHLKMKEYLVSMGVDGVMATDIVTGMKDGEMPHVEINY